MRRSSRMHWGAHETAPGGSPAAHAPSLGPRTKHPTKQGLLQMAPPRCPLALMPPCCLAQRAGAPPPPPCRLAHRAGARALRLPRRCGRLRCSTPPRPFLSPAAPVALFNASTHELFVARAQPPRPATDAVCRRAVSCPAPLPPLTPHPPLIPHSRPQAVPRRIDGARRQGLPCCCRRGCAPLARAPPGRQRAGSV
ncbi:MAG: hypothetical protein J3K34DRAFT_407837 [Monoraphidium minutum]|nr:MAG: hypothetical protein J3K34DRAFT_407837 [Monoraphidium minutum]